MTPVLKTLIAGLLTNRSVSEVTAMVNNPPYTVITRREVEAVRRQLVASGELEHSDKSFTATGPAIHAGHEQAGIRKDAETGSARLAEAMQGYYRRTARTRGCRVETARLLALYSRDEIVRMHGVGRAA